MGTASFSLLIFLWLHTSLNTQKRPIDFVGCMFRDEKWVSLIFFLKTKSLFHFFFLLYTCNHYKFNINECMHINGKPNEHLGDFLICLTFQNQIERYTSDINNKHIWQCSIATEYKTKGGKNPWKQRCTKSIFYF